MSNQKNIEDFRGEYRWLSNFEYCPIRYEGIDYPTTEHAYQASKTLDVNERIKISLAETPGKSKRMGYKLKLREDWENIKLSVMKDILRIKFSQPEYKEKLLSTGNVRLIEGNSWQDVFWGVCNGVGENHLGKILMQIRAELRQEPEDKQHGR